MDAHPVQERPEDLPPAPSPSLDDGTLTPTATQYRALLKTLKGDRHSVAKHLDVARFLLKVGHPDRSFSSLRVARALQPRRPETYRLLGWAYQRRGDLAQAATAYRQLLHGAADDLAGRFQLGRVLHAQGKGAEAARHLARAVELCPNLTAGWRLLAAIAEAQGDLGTTLAHLEHLEALRPDDPAVKLAQGRVHRKAGRPDRAVLALRRCLELEPEALDARLELIRVVLDEGDPHGALKLIAEGYAVSQNHLDLLLLEGRARNEVGERERALAAYITASRRAPDDWRPHLELGKLYSLQEDYDLAAEECAAALRLNPREPDVYRSLGSLHVRAGAPGRAEATFVQMTETFPGSAEAWRLLGEVRERFQRVLEARQAYGRALELAPADATLYCARARVSIKAGSYDEAIADFQRARDLDPECEEARCDTELIRGHKKYQEAFAAHERAVEAQALGELETAKGHYERVVELVPNNLRWLDEHARLAVALGSYGDAIDALERILALDVAHGAVLLRLGDLLQSLDRYGEATRLYERAVTGEPLNIGVRVRLIRALGHRAIAGDLSPDKFPRLEAAYRAGLTEPGRAALAHLELGYLYLYLGSQIFPATEWHQKAQEHFRAVGDRGSPETTRQRLLGEVDLARRTGRDEEALAGLERLCELFPDQPAYALGLLEYLKLVGGHARALRLSEGFAQRFPDHGLIRALGLEFFARVAATNENPRALCRRRIAELQRRVAQDPQDPTAYLDLALGLLVLSPAGERFESSRKVVIALNRARALAPRSPWVFWGFLQEAARPADHAEQPGGPPPASALTVCQNGLRLFPEHSPFLEYMGRALLGSRDPVEVDRGRQFLLRATVVDPDCVGAQFSLGAHYEGLGEAAAARHHYVKILESPRGASLARKAIDRLQRIVG